MAEVSDFSPKGHKYWPLNLLIQGPLNLIPPSSPQNTKTPEFFFLSNQRGAAPRPIKCVPKTPLNPP